MVAERLFSFDDTEGKTVAVAPGRVALIESGWSVEGPSDDDYIARWGAWVKDGGRGKAPTPDVVEPYRTTVIRVRPGGFASELVTLRSVEPIDELVARFNRFVRGEDAS